MSGRPYNKLSAHAQKKAIADRRAEIEEQGIGDTDDAAIIRGFEINGARFDVYGGRVV